MTLTLAKATIKHKGITLPDRFVTETCAVLARRGAGKTYTALKLAEELYLASESIVDFDDLRLSDVQRFARALGLQVVIGLTQNQPRGEAMLEDIEIARIAHEANRALQTIQMKTTPGITPAPAWDATSDEMKASAVAGVEAIRAGKNPEETHEAWCDFKAQNGWTYGPVKDEIGKTHPNLVPYAELPDDQKIKDDLFSAIVHVFIHARLNPDLISAPPS